MRDFEKELLCLIVELVLVVAIEIAQEYFVPPAFNRIFNIDFLVEKKKNDI